MTERAPTGQSTLEKERAKLAKKREKLEYKQRILEGGEAFGMYDTDVTPAEGELTYEQYLEQRPSDGIVRTYGGRYLDTQTNKHAEEVDYEAQYEDALDKHSYTDRINAAIKSNEGVTFESPYAHLGFAQLAREYSLASSRVDARGDVDRTAMQDIKEALREFLENDIIATTNDEESSEAAQDRYDAEYARFDSLVAGFDQLRKAAVSGKEAESDEVQAEAVEEPVSEVSTPDSVEPTEEERVNEEAPDAQQPVAEKVAEEVVAKDEPPVEEFVLPEPTVSNQSDFHPVEGAFTRTNPDLTHLATALPEEADPTAPPIRVSAFNRGVQPGDRPAEAPVSVVVAEPKAEQTASKKIVDEKSAEKAQEEVSRRERLKKWFNKKDGLREKLGVSYWAAKWQAYETEKSVKDRVLDIGVEDSMSEEEKEKKRRRNRTVAIVGASVLAVGAVTAAIGLGVHVANNIVDNETAQAAHETVGVRHMASFPVEVGDAAASADAAPTTPEIPIPPEAFTVPSGGGGEQLLSSLQIDPSKWYGIENTLLDQFPDDFYRMADGHVGIARPGILPQGAQDIISSLR